jgi:hypothetical protein
MGETITGVPPMPDSFYRRWVLPPGEGPFPLPEDLDAEDTPLVIDHGGEG